MTHIIRPITPNEQQTLGLIISDPSTSWQPHLPAEIFDLTALRDGQSLHIRFLDESLKDMPAYDRRSQYPALMQMFNDISDGRIIGRAYLHKLAPGQTILRHLDDMPGYFDRVDTRFHIYLDIPSGAKLIFNDVEQDTAAFANKLVDFSYREWHEYRNEGSTEWVFCVFDAMML